MFLTILTLEIILQQSSAFQGGRFDIFLKAGAFD